MKKIKKFLRNPSFKYSPCALKLVYTLVNMLLLSAETYATIRKGMEAMILRTGFEKCSLIFEELFGSSIKERTMRISGKEDSPDFARQRADMVKFQLQARGIRDKGVLDAMGKVPRHLFVPDNLKDQAYADSALPIGYNQTISQPYIVALMCETASILPHEKVLEIGTGSGYQAAVLRHLSRMVYTIELIAPLGSQAKKSLKELGYHNIHIKIGDGYFGWPDHAPYDVILITAATEEIPEPLIDQLALNGRLIMPVGSGFQQELVRFVKNDKGGLEKESLGSVVFVPFKRGSEI